MVVWSQLSRDVGLVQPVSVNVMAHGPQQGVSSHTLLYLSEQDPMRVDLRDEAVSEAISESISSGR